MEDEVVDEAYQQDLVSSVEKLYERCQYILSDCSTRQETRPLDGMYRLVQPLTSECLFLEKVRSIDSPRTLSLMQFSSILAMK
jgi:hypothetical protein